MKPTARPQSPRLIEANRRNARRSTGPRTAEGKAISRLNGLTHGLTSQLDLPDCQEIRNYPGPFAAETHQPTAEQAAIARRIAEDRWRLRHACDVENNWFAETAGNGTALNVAETFHNHSKRLLLFTLYEQRIRRTIEKNSWRLKHLRDE
jgi:hypothetical protein